MKTGEDQAPGMAELTNDLTRIREDLGRLTETVTQMLAGGSGSVTERVRGTVEGARQNLAGTADTMMQSSREYMHGAQGMMRDAAGRLESSVERNPLTAVMVAAALGLVVGMMGRGHDDHR